MLPISHISKIEIYSEEWNLFRSGKFTSSKINVLMSESPLTKGALSYIYQKAGEYITGHNTEDPDDEVEDENTAWGLQYETEGLQKFGQRMKIKYLVTQKLISKPGSMFSSTPDSLWIIDSSVLQPDCYNVATVEIKCPRKFPRFIPLFKCKTPFELKAHEPKYYWQVLDQMDNCHSAVGYFSCYHPQFPANNNQSVIEFRKIDLWDDFKKLQFRKEQAFNKFNEVLAEFGITPIQKV